MIKTEIEKFKNLFSKDSLVHELIFTEINSYEESFDNPDFLESLNDLFYVIYSLGKEKELIPFYEYYKNVTPVSDKRIWTWIESSLLLFSVVFSEINKPLESEECIELVKKSFGLGNDLVVSVNVKARERKMNGELLSIDDIEESIEDEDKEEELMSRITYLKELMYIKALGYSQVMEKNITNDKINENIDELKKLF